MWCFPLLSDRVDVRLRSQLRTPFPGPLHDELMRFVRSLDPGCPQITTVTAPNGTCPLIRQHGHTEFGSENAPTSRVAIARTGDAQNSPAAEELLFPLFIHGFNYWQYLPLFWQFNSYIPRCFEKPSFPICNEVMARGNNFFKLTLRVYNWTGNLLWVSQINDECFLASPNSYCI